MNKEYKKNKKEIQKRISEEQKEKDYLLSMGLKYCSGCDKILTLDSFYLLKQDHESKYSSRCKDCISNYRYANIEKYREYARNYYHKHRPEIIERNKASGRKRKRETDPIKLMAIRTRSMISKAFARNNHVKNSHTKEILGIDLYKFYEYLMYTFYNRYGYDWDGSEPVEIDHIIPLATVKTEEDIIKLNHYTNLQLLRTYDNKMKSSSLDWDKDGV